MIKLLMADRSIKRPIRVLFDKLVKVNIFILLANFLVLVHEIYQELLIIIGQPFLFTVRAIIDLELREIIFRVHDGEVPFWV